MARALEEESSGGGIRSTPTGGGNPVLNLPKYVKVNWEHTDPNPLAVRGYRIAFFIGGDPNDTSKHLFFPVEVGPNERTLTKTVTVDQSRTINTAVQTLYKNGNESSWRLVGGALVLDPDTVELGTKAAVDSAQSTADTANANALAATDLAGKVVKPTILWDFSGGSLPGGGTFGGTVAASDNGTTTTLTNTLSDQSLRLPMNLDPSKCWAIAMRVKLVTGPWEGTIYPTNGAHGESASYYKSIPAPAVGAWTTIVVDMRTLTAGGTDYMTGGIVAGIRVDFTEAAGTQVVVDWMAVGVFGAVSQGDVDTAKSDAISAAAADATTKAANAQSTAISTAADDALAKANTAQMKAPAIVGWNYANRASNLFSPGLCAITADGKTIQMNASGTAWNDITVAATGLFGKLFTSQLVVANQGDAINSDPGFMDPTIWSGGNLSITAEPNCPGGGSRALYNGSGSAGWTSPNTEWIPVDPTKNYRAEVWIYRSGGTGSDSTYAGIIWYDVDKNVASSNIAQPGGAGNPAGWANGSYSYFPSCANVNSPWTWTKYTVDFGPDEVCKIPSNARFFQGVLGLNNANLAGATLLASNFRIVEKVSGDVLVDGAVRARHVDAAAVTARSMVLANTDNLIPNPNSEQAAPTGGWPAGAYENRGVVTYGVRTGTKARELVGDGGYNSLDITPFIPCSPGDKFLLSAYGFRSALTGGNARMYMVFFAADKTTTTGYQAIEATTTSYPATPYQLALAAPAGSSFVLIRMENDLVPVGTSAYWDDMYFRRMADGALIVDGAITAQKVAAASITAEKMVLSAASLITDPYFQSGTSGWFGHTGLVIPGSSLSECPGAYAGQFNERDCPNKGSINVKAGEKYFCSLSMYAYGGGGGQGMGIVWFGFDRSGNVVEVSILANTTNTSSWVTLSGVITVGPNTVYMTVGPWMDIPYGWVSANGGPLFTNMVLRKMADSSLIVDGSILASKIDANAIQTTNYGEDVNGYPTAGAKMQTNGTALKVAPGQFLLGSTYFSDYFWGRVNQAIDGSAANGRVNYRGNNDTTVRGGSPDITKLTVTPTLWDTTNKVSWIDLKFQPTGVTDNLDSMRRAVVQVYRQSALGTTATLTAVGALFKQPLTDRLYGNVASDSNAANANEATMCISHFAIASAFPAALVTLYNAYGNSAGGCFYAPTGWTVGNALTYNGSSWPAGITGGSSGGSSSGSGGSGGGCPAPWVQIQLASGMLVDAGSLYDGAVVIGVDDSTMQPKTGVVRHPRTVFKMRQKVVFMDNRETEFSSNHRFFVEGRGWTELRHLRPGDSILSNRPSIVKTISAGIRGPVVDFQVEGCATYFSDDLLSHNAKVQ